MDNREKIGAVQPGREKIYTLDELLKVMEPQYQVYKFTMRQCIAGLTEHAARLAAQGQEKSLPRLRQLCIEMAEFWGLTEEDTPRGYREWRSTSAALSIARYPLPEVPVMRPH